MSANERFILKKNYIFWSIALLCALFIFYKIKTVLLPFYISMFVTILFGGIVSKLHRRFHVPRSITAGAITLFFCIFIISCLYLLFNISLTKATHSVVKIKNNQDVVDGFSLFIGNLLKKFEIDNIFNWFAGQFSDIMANYVSFFFTKIVNYSTNIISVVFLCVLSPIVMFMMLKDAPLIGRKTYALLPKNIQSETKKLADEIYKSVFRYLEGQTMTAIVLSCCYAVLLLLMGVKHFIVLGVLIGFSSFIPYVGFYLATGITLISVYNQFHDFKRIIITLIVLLVMQIVDSGFITPKIVGNKLGVHPLLVILGVLVSVPLFGVIGVFLALPLVGIMSVVVKFFLEKYKKSSYYS